MVVSTTTLGPFHAHKCWISYIAQRLKVKIERSVLIRYNGLSIPNITLMNLRTIVLYFYLLLCMGAQGDKHRHRYRKRTEKVVFFPIHLAP